MNYFPRLNSERLILKKLEAENLTALTRLANNKKVSDQIVNIPHPYTDINASMRLGYVTKGFKEGSRYCFSIFTKDRMEFIGEISLHETDKENSVAELGYWIGEPYWNKGFVGEAVAPVVQFGFEKVGYQTIYATVRTGNIASERVLVKNGFEKFKEDALQKAYKISKEGIMK